MWRFIFTTHDRTVPQLSMQPTQRLVYLYLCLKCWARNLSAASLYLPSNSFYKCWSPSGHTASSLQVIDCSTLSPPQPSLYTGIQYLYSAFSLYHGLVRTLQPALQLAVRNEHELFRLILSATFRSAWMPERSILLHTVLPYQDMFLNGTGCVAGLSVMSAIFVKHFKRKDIFALQLILLYCHVPWYTANLYTSVHILSLTLHMTTVEYVQVGYSFCHLVGIYLTPHKALPGKIRNSLQIENISSQSVVIGCPVFSNFWKVFCSYEVHYHFWSDDIWSSRSLLPTLENHYFCKRLGMPNIKCFYPDLRHPSVLSAIVQHLITSDFACLIHQNMDNLSRGAYINRSLLHWLRWE